MMVSEGKCDSYITTREECQQAAQEIDREAACRKWGGPEVCKWTNTAIGRNYRQNNHPPGCYLVWVWSQRVLSWNSESPAYGECSRGTECICKSTTATTATAVTTTTSAPTTETTTSTRYIMKSEGQCDSYITTPEECEQAAREIDREAACRKWGGPEVCKWPNPQIQSGHKR